MHEQLINDITSQLYGKLCDEDLETVIKTVTTIINDYDISKKERSVVPYTAYIPECYKAFLVTKKIEGKSDKSLKLYKLYLDEFFNALQTPIEQINANMIKVYLYKLKDGRGISNRTLDSHRSILNSFFAWSAAEGYLDKNPMATIKPIKYEVEERKPLSDVELEKVRRACADIREQAIVEFLYSTGCRVTEMERMNKSDVDFATSEVKLFGKGNKHRTSYLSAKASLYLQDYLASRDDDNEALFVYSKHPHERLCKSGIEKIVGSIGKRAGIDRLHPHLLRHTVATNCLRSGMDVTQLKELLGHSRLDTTMIYAKVDNSDIKRNHARYV